MTVSPGPRGCPRRVVRGVLLREGRVLLSYHRGAMHVPRGWDLLGGHAEPGESPQAALERKLREVVGAEVDLAGRAPEFHLAGADDEISLWVLRAWRGELPNLVGEEHSNLGWFAGEELGRSSWQTPVTSGCSQASWRVARPGWHGQRTGPG